MVHGTVTQLNLSIFCAPNTLHPPPLPHTTTSSLMHTLTDSDRSLGMVIVSGKAQSVHGKVLEGVFVQKILPGSPADRDGRYVNYG